MNNCGKNLQKSDEEENGEDETLDKEFQEFDSGLFDSSGDELAMGIKDNDVLDDKEDANSVSVTETKKIVEPVGKKTDVKKSRKRKLNTKNVSTVSSHVIIRNSSKRTTYQSCRK